MSTTLLSPPAPRLAPEWQDWLASNISRGCTDSDMLGVMRDNGFDEHYSRVAISIIRSMTERVQATTPGALVSDYQPEPIRIAGTGIIRAHDRDIGIGFTLANPNVALIEELLSEKECEELIRLSAGKLKRSEVVGKGGGGTEVSAVRTSDGTHFQRGENALVERLEKRIHALTGIPVENGEPFQILHYESAGEYLPHHDYFDPQQSGSAEHMRAGGQRVATMVIYLNDVQAGGETAFPELELLVKARRGHAIYFEYCNAAGQLDARCLHAGLPVTRGEKWIATKWLRQSAYSTP